jgi:mRNA interferase RelE/StbE
LAWTINSNSRARKQLASLDRKVQDTVARYVQERIAPLEDPQQEGQPLVSELKGYWRYRVGDSCVLAEISDESITSLVVRVGHRREVYQ